MENKMFLMNISDKLEFIEDGINALRALERGRNDSVDCVMDEYEYTNAQAWIFDHLMTDLQIVRAEVSRKRGLKMDA